MQAYARPFRIRKHACIFYYVTKPAAKKEPTKPGLLLQQRQRANCTQAAFRNTGTRLLPCLKSGRPSR